MWNGLYELLWNLRKWREYPGIHARLRELNEEAGLPHRAWEGRREERLRRLLTFARDHVPYYRRLFAAAGFDPLAGDLTRDLARVPLLTRDLVRTHRDELVAENADRSRFYENATGGSTGAPITFYQDRAYQAVSLALDTWVRSWWGIGRVDRTALVWGADRDLHDLSPRERLYQWTSRLRCLNAFRMTEESLFAFCRMLRQWRPPYLVGYASALEALAQSARDHGISGLAFKAIRSSAEMLWPSTRRLLEDVLHGPVYNFYGSREVNNLAAECPEERRLHLISTWRYVEVVDDGGGPMPEGETGQIAVTDLSNFAMPFIRYANEDIGRLAGKPCPCGRPSPVLDALLGRRTDLIRTSRGDIIHGEFFTHLFYGRDDIRQFQIRQTALDRLVVRYVPAGTTPEAFLEGVAAKIRARMGEGVGIEFERCEAIPVPLSGKHRFTISEIDDAAPKASGC